MTDFSDANVLFLFMLIGDLVLVILIMLLGLSQASLDGRIKKLEEKLRRLEGFVEGVSRR